MDRVAARYVIEKIVAHTQFMKSLYLQAGIRENKVTVIPHCVDLHRIKSAISQRVSRTLVPPSERQTIFYAGKFNIMKGVKELVECYKGICEIQGTRLVLMGKGPLEKWLLQQKQEIEHRSATAQILLLPWQQHPVMLSCMAEANIVVCPSLVEPFGIFMLEAMSLGKPVIATHFGGPSEIICDHVNGLLIDPRNHRQFKAALLELLTDENIRTRTSLNALETVQSKYEVSKVATRFLRFLGDEE